MSYRAEGAQAARDGLPIGANPYDPGARYANEEWAYGWRLEQPRIAYRAALDASDAALLTAVGQREEAQTHRAVLAGFALAVLNVPHLRSAIEQELIGGVEGVIAIVEEILGDPSTGGLIKRG